jgi:hypothetical protein
VPTASSPSDAVGRAVHVRVGRRQESAGLNELDDRHRSSAAARWLDRCEFAVIGLHGDRGQELLLLFMAGLVEVFLEHPASSVTITR